MLSYVTAVYLRGVSHGLPYLLNFVRSLRQKPETSTQPASAKKPERSECERPVSRSMADRRPPDASRKFHFIRHKNAVAGSHIAKLRAEKHGAIVLQTGSALALAIDVASCSDGQPNRIRMALALAAGLVALEFYKRHLQNAITSAIDNHAYMLGYAESPTEATVIAGLSVKADATTPPDD